MSEIKGKLHKVGQTIQVSEAFSKRVFVIEDSTGMYPQLIELQLTKDKCILLDGLNVGDEVDVKFNLRGKEWTNPTTGEIKYFNTLEAWQINVLNKFTTAPQPQGVGQVESDLPF